MIQPQSSIFSGPCEHHPIGSSGSSGSSQLGSIAVGLREATLAPGLVSAVAGICEGQRQLGIGGALPALREVCGFLGVDQDMGMGQYL